MNQSTTISAERIRFTLQSRFSPIRNLTPELLSSQLEDFKIGYLRGAALTWDAIEQRDLLIKNVVGKRKKAVSRNGWEILAVDDTPEAQQHKAALEFFYNNLTATNVIEQDDQGGLNLLLRQMMDCVGKRYAVHEIVWKPQTASGMEMVTRGEGEADGKKSALHLDSFLTAEFRFVPLWFFESRTGKLRFLQQEHAVDGVPMMQGDWMVTVGDGLMEATSVGYMFKNLPLKDWLALCEKFGMPGIDAATDATPGSDDWNNLKEAVAAFGQDWAVIRNRAAQINFLEAGNVGNSPQQPLVEYMDRAIASLWRGADLATIAKGDGTGASLQQDEGDILNEDDLVLCEDALNERASKWCIYYLFGTKRSLAYLKLSRPQNDTVDRDLKVDEFLVRHGVPVSVKDTLERYERPMPDKGDVLLSAPAAPALPEDSSELANSRPPGVSKVQVNRLAAAFAEDLKPLRDRVERILAIDDVDLQRAKLQAFLNDLPQLLKDINADPESARVLEDALQRGILTGGGQS